VSSINADNGVVSGITGVRVTADSTGNLALQSNGVSVLTLATNNTATFAGNVTTAGLIVGTTALGAGNATRFKNRIINGNMVIDQRNAGASITPSDSQYTVDRFVYFATQASKFTAQQNKGSITSPVGFSNYLGLSTASAVSVGAGDYFMINQLIEGFNTADFQWGTANAKTVTLSFQVYSSLTGTFGGVITNSALNRSYPFTYTISSANTWTSASITIAGDTTGTWIGATNGCGIRIMWGLGVGSTYSGTAGAWAGATYFSATGATSVVGTSGATFYITGVQLEVGSSATGFEVTDYTTQLAMCQRYYYAIGGNSFLNPSNNTYVIMGTGKCFNTYQGDAMIPFKVMMRTTPTAATANTCIEVAGTGYGVTSMGDVGSSPNAMYLRCSTAGTFTAGYAAVLSGFNNTTAYITFSAEL
jgi:hypothetical protein